MSEKEITRSLTVIGAGGTGGRFISSMSQYLQGSRVFKFMNIVDGDVVEEHNLARQAVFCEDDIGAKKANALTEPLNEVYGLKWKAFPIYLENVEQLKKITHADEVDLPIIIGTVDNHGARLVMENFFREVQSCIYIDSANEFADGEVVSSVKLMGKQLSPLRSQIFPEILKGDIRNVTEMSCEELNTSSPQHNSINIMAGNIVFSMVAQLLEDNKLFTGFSCFNSRNFSSEWIELKMKGERICSA